MKKIIPQKNTAKKWLVTTIKDREGKEYKVVAEQKKEKLLEERTIFEIVDEKGNVLSTATLVEQKKKGKKEAKVTNVETTPGYRKKGFADLLMGFVEKEAFIKGHKKITLFALNPTAIEMYKKRNFKKITRNGNVQIREYAKEITPKSFIDFQNVKKKNKKRRRRF